MPLKHIKKHPKTQKRLNYPFFYEICFFKPESQKFFDFSFMWHYPKPKNKYKSINIFILTVKTNFKNVIFISGYQYFVNI